MASWKVRSSPKRYALPSMSGGHPILSVDTRSRATRRLLRHEWQPTSATAQEIEAATAELLSDPDQAALAQQQMDNRKPI